MSNTGAKTKAVVRTFFNRRQLTLSLLGAVVGLVVGGSVAIWARARSGLLERWESATIDLRLKSAAHPEKIAPDLTVLLIDDTTESDIVTRDLAFPPDRSQMARVLEVLALYKPRAVVFDYLFDNAPVTYQGAYFDPYQPHEFGSANAYAASLDFGRKALLVGRVVIGARWTDVPDTTPADALQSITRYSPYLEPYLQRRLIEVEGEIPHPYPGIPGRIHKLNYPEAHVIAGARGFGITNITDADQDDIPRRFRPVGVVDGRTLVQLAVAGAAVAATTSAETASWALDAPPPAGSLASPATLTLTRDELVVGARRIPLRDDGTAWVRWRGDWEDPASPLAAHVHSIFPYLAQENQDQVLLDEGKGTPPPGIVPADITDKVVLIGFSVHGEFTDKVSTPYGFMPGVYFQAAILDTLLTGDAPRSIPRWLDFALIVAMSMLVGALVFGLPKFDWLVARGMAAVGVYQGLLVVLPLSLYALLALAAYPRGLVVNVVPAELGMAGTGLLVFFASIGIERAALEAQRLEKEQALALAKKALSPELVEQYQATYAGAPPLGGERVELTVYFSDIAGFTTISEALPPEELIGILNEYLSRVTELMVDKHRAYLDKYIGDAVMAFWGAPLPAPDGATKACFAALDTMAAMSAYSAELVARGLTPLKTRIGINTGPAIAGVVGHAKSKINYTALGDTVNLASRLEGANKAYGTTCMLGPGTYEAAKDVILARELDSVKVKGKHIAVRVYELMGRQSDPLPREREIKKRYEAALALFRARRFEEARAAFAELQEKFGDPPAKTLARSCEEMIATPPPPDWDGSNELHEK